MRYRVRTPEGELVYPSLHDLVQAYVTGLVDPGDEVLEEGGTLWRKAETLPLLARARSVAPKPWERSQALTIAAALGLAALALFLLWNGAGLLPILAVALLIVSLLTRVTMKAFKRRPPS